MPRARHSVAEFADAVGADGRKLDDIRLTVTEAVTNVVQHAYHGTAGEIHIDAQASRSELHISVADDGCGLERATENPGLGLGLGLMAELSDGFSVISRRTGGLDVKLRFDLRSQARQRSARRSPTSGRRLASRV